MSKIVIALGGNALGKTPEEQKLLVKKAADIIVSIAKDNDVIVTHGNGPQVGMIANAFEYASKFNVAPFMPFAECGAMSQGYIGYHLQNAINEKLRENNTEKKCATIITQVEVDENDEAFTDPTKPVGMFYTKEEADKLASSNGYKYVEDSGRGYRRVVPSPKPERILEQEIVSNLADDGNIVITVGGGGIPVVKDGLGYKGVDAVIDKDFASSKLAANIKADILLILTAVDKVYINFNTPNQKGVDSTDTLELQKYIDEGHFAKGSMLPKINACMNFLNENSEGTAIIASLNEGLEAINGDKGTKIFYRRK